jgi:hypothetical protein
MKSWVALAIVLSSTLLAPRDSRAMQIVARGDSLEGRVFDTFSHRGVAGLQVQLTAPRAEQLPVRVTMTAGDGSYKFTHVRKGKYLLEVYHGVTLLSRREIDTRAPIDILIPLRPAPPGGVHAP